MSSSFLYSLRQLPREASAQLAENRNLASFCQRSRGKLNSKWTDSGLGSKKIIRLLKVSTDRKMSYLQNDIFETCLYCDAIIFHSNQHFGQLFQLLHSQTHKDRHSSPPWQSCLRGHPVLFNQIRLNKLKMDQQTPPSQKRKKKKIIKKKLKIIKIIVKTFSNRNLGSDRHHLALPPFSHLSSAPS